MNKLVAIAITTLFFFNHNLFAQTNGEQEVISRNSSPIFSGESLAANRSASKPKLHVPYL